MIDKNDIAILRCWLTLAETQGTDAIRITEGEEPATWIIHRPPKEGEQP